MATRFYLPSSGAAGASPAYDASWEGTDEAARLRCVTTPGSTAMTTVTGNETSTSGSHDELIRQYVSDPIAAQTISGTLKGQIRALENAGTANMRAQMVVRVVSNDGSTVRGTLIAASTSGLSSEFSDVELTNRKFPLGWTGSGASVSSVAASAGDRIVIEVGYRAHNTTSAGRAASLHIGDTAGSDLPEDEITATERRPWVEFSANIAFQGGDFTLAADPGSYTATGVAASLKRSAEFAAAQGSLALDGQAATLRYTKTLLAGTAGYSLGGQPASLEVSRRMAAGTGVYTVSGQIASLERSTVLAAATGTYALTGIAAGLERSLILPAEAGQYLLGGNDATLVFESAGEFILAADAGFLSLSGQSGLLTIDRVMRAEAGHISITGIDAQLSYAASTEQYGGWPRQERNAYLSTVPRWLLRQHAERREEAERDSEAEAAAEHARLAEIARRDAAQREVERIAAELTKARRDARAYREIERLKQELAAARTARAEAARAEEQRRARVEEEDTLFMLLAA